MYPWTPLERRSLQVQHEQIHEETLRRLAAAQRALKRKEWDQYHIDLACYGRAVVPTQ